MKILAPMPAEVDDLRELAEFIAGIGLLAGPLTSYPSQEGGLHEACLRLEAAHVVRRRADTGWWVQWEIEPELVKVLDKHQ